MPNIYRLDEDFLYYTDIAVDRHYLLRDSNHKVIAHILPNGTILIFSGYCWNGASPKIKIGNIIFGTWDGKIEKDGKPQLYYPTLCHDLLIETLEQHPYSRKQVDNIFLSMMQRVKFALASLYYWSVRIFGRCYTWINLSLKSFY